MSHAETLEPPRRWYDGLTGYHVFIIAIAAMGWMFDTMDQWLYVLVKSPALSELLKLPQSHADTKWWVGVAQMVFILGWATGGLFFGMVGDRLGRTKTMAFTILIYASFTGLSGLAQTPLQFTILRFLTGLGIGGEFAAGASLVAETIPGHIRPIALGIVQALSALGNVLAAVINLTIGADPNWGWRWVFAVGVIPAFLLFIIFTFVREPEAWLESRRRIRSGIEKRNAIPVLDLFRTRTLLHHTLIGVGLGAIGVIGFWGIGTWSTELIRGILNPHGLPELKSAVERQVSLCIISQNLGGFFGVFAYSFMAHRMGRRPAFAISLLMCLIVIPTAFYQTHSFNTGMLYFGLMGFALLSVFGGYSIYFPELFPTRLRATGTGFCYNVARYISAFAPYTFGQLSAVYGIQRAALILSSVFVLGLLIIPFAPETRGKALPE